MKSQPRSPCQTDCLPASHHQKLSLMPSAQAAHVGSVWSRIGQPASGVQKVMSDSKTTGGVCWKRQDICHGTVRCMPGQDCEADHPAADSQTTITEIEWTRSGSRSHRVTIARSDDGYPPSWNRRYEKGILVGVWQGTPWFQGNRFYDCSFWSMQNVA